jgi:hypothetical protein
VMGPISIVCFWLGLKPYARSVERMGAHREVAVAPASH